MSLRLRSKVFDLCVIFCPSFCPSQGKHLLFYVVPSTTAILHLVGCLQKNSMCTSQIFFVYFCFCLIRLVSWALLCGAYFQWLNKICQCQIERIIFYQQLSVVVLMQWNSFSSVYLCIFRMFYVFFYVDLLKLLEELVRYALFYSYAKWSLQKLWAWTLAEVNPKEISCDVQWNHSYLIIFDLVHIPFSHGKRPQFFRHLDLTPEIQWLTVNSSICEIWELGKVSKVV